MAHWIHTVFLERAGARWHKMAGKGLYQLYPIIHPLLQFLYFSGQSRAITFRVEWPNMVAILVSYKPESFPPYYTSRLLSLLLCLEITLLSLIKSNLTAVYAIGMVRFISYSLCLELFYHGSD